jgi:uncharacterized membrane protein YsdA (DUF1294 family)
MRSSETLEAGSEVISACKDDWFFVKKRNIIEIDRKQGGEPGRMVKVIMLWFVVINIIGYVVMSEDKNKARKRRERVPEKTLFLLAAMGGALGVLIAMYRKRHKTRHMSFRIGIPLLLLLNIFLYSYFLR